MRPHAMPYTQIFLFLLFVVLIMVGGHSEFTSIVQHELNQKALELKDRFCSVVTSYYAEDAVAN